MRSTRCTRVSTTRADCRCPATRPTRCDHIDVGPDNEPLLVDVRPIAWLCAELVAEARDHHRHRMRAGRSVH